MQYGAAVVGSVGEDLSDGLLGGDVIALLHGSGGQVAVDGDIIAVADEDVEQAVQFEDGGNLSVEDGTGLRSRFALDVNTFIVQLDIAQALYCICLLYTSRCV